MNEVYFAIPGDPDTRTGGYIYDKRVMAELAALGKSPRLIRLPDGFPLPSPGARQEAEERLDLVPDGALLVVDGLALGALPDAAASLARRLDLVALVHHPLALEEGLADEDRTALRESETRALAQAARVIVTGAATARILARDYDIAGERLAVVMPGTEPAPLAPADAGVPTLLTIATVTPRKAHDVVVRALASLRSFSWRWLCVGSLDRDREWSAAVQRDVRKAGLGERVQFAGEVGETELVGFYDRADVFVLPSHFEGYGMALAEAVARGLPLVTAPTAAIVDSLPAACMRLVEPGDVEALAATLKAIFTDPDLREGLRQGARIARAGLPRWQETGCAFARELQQVRCGF